MDEGKEIWLARDDHQESGYDIFRGKPAKEGGIYYGDIVDHVWTSDLEEMTGYKLSPGECRRVRIKIEEVK